MRRGRFMKRFRHGEKGFTLVELLIVVAILGILAALIIPNVTTFLTSGKVGAGRAETSVLQTSVDGMMADAGVIATTAVASWDGSTAAVVDETVGGVTYDATDYIRRSVTANSTWSVAADGEITCTAFDGITVAADPDFIARINS